MVERSRRQMKSCHSHCVRSEALVSEGLRQMERCSAPEEFTAAQSRWLAAQGASEQRQASGLRKQAMRERAAEAVSYRMEEEEADEAEGMFEAAALVGAPEAAQLQRAAVDGAGAADEFQKLLQQLKTEPTDDTELVAKFGLYETYGQQVERIRGTLFGLYEENKPTLPDAIQKDMDRQLKHVDRHEAMGIHDDARGWFVYHMMAQAGKNNQNMSNIMGGFEQKLDFLAKNDQTECPVCLEEFSPEAPAETLGCCHKVCRECWAHWTTVMRGHPFCPLCRNEEFVEALHRRVAA